MAEPLPRRLARVAGFAALYLLLQTGYQALREGPDTPWVIERGIVLPAAALIGGVLPADGVVAQGARLVWPGGRLQLLAGCDGFELLIMLVAATLVAPVSWRRGLFMLGVGGAGIWALNELRLFALYLSFRHWRESFDAVHTVWAPLLLLGALAGWFAWNLRRPG